MGKPNRKDATSASGTRTSVDTINPIPIDHPATASSSSSGIDDATQLLVRMAVPIGNRRLFFVSKVGKPSCSPSFLIALMNIFLLSFPQVNQSPPSQDSAELIRQATILERSDEILQGRQLRREIGEMMREAFGDSAGMRARESGWNPAAAISR